MEETEKMNDRLKTVEVALQIVKLLKDNNLIIWGYEGEVCGCIINSEDHNQSNECWIDNEDMKVKSGGDIFGRGATIYE